MMFSVIIPIFNVAEHLREAIESVLSQDFADLQVILVNDGSTDESLSICKEFEVRDRRVVLIDQANQGVSAARNAGLERAEGVYIMFLDGDDFMEPGALSVLSSFLLRRPDLDLVTCAHRESYRGGETVVRPVPDASSGLAMSRREYLEAFGARRLIPWAVWKNVFRAELVQSAHLRFDPTLVRAEDALFFADFVREAEKFEVFSFPVCTYRIGHSTSAMQQMSPNHLKSRLVVRVELFERALKCHLMGQGDFRSEVANMFAGDVSDLWQIRERAARHELEGFIKGHREIFAHVRDLKLRFFRVLTQTFGLYGGAIVYRKLRTCGRNVELRLKTRL